MTEYEKIGLVGKLDGGLRERAPTAAEDMAMGTPAEAERAVGGIKVTAEAENPYVR